MTLLYIKLIFRKILRNKVYTSLNLFGIVLGISASILLLLFVKKEIETDMTLPGYENIYRVENNGRRNFSRKKIEVLQSYVPEFEHVTRYHGSWSQQDLLEYKNENFLIENAFYGDSAFFRVFQFEPLYGDLANSLSKPNNIVLSKSESEKIFGEINPVGESVLIKTSLYGMANYTVSAVVKDIPNNSSFKFNVVFSLSSLSLIESYNSDADNWGSGFYSCFVKVIPGADITTLPGKIDALYAEHAPNWVSQDLSIGLNPLRGLHFSKQYGDGVFHTMKKPIVLILSTIGILILLISCFNYFNLSVAQMQEGLRGIGIKKTIGAKASNLGIQFLIETVIYLLIGFVGVVFLITLLLPHFNQFTNSSFTLMNMLSGSNLVFLFLFFSVSVLLFGVFPPQIYSRQKALALLSSKANIKERKFNLKNGMIVFQFFIAILITTSALMIQKQYKFMLNSDYGYTTENIIYMPLSPESREEKNYLEQEFESLAITREVAFATNAFGSVANSWGRGLKYDGRNIHVDFEVMGVSHDFLKLFDVILKEGRGFDLNSSEKAEVIFNQAFVEKYELENPTSAKVSTGEGRGNVVAVVDNFHHSSLRDKVSPFGMVCHDGGNVLFVKFNSSNTVEIGKAIAHFQKIWDKVSPNYPFEYYSMNGHLKDVYKLETNILKILLTAAILAISLASTGLIGLSYFITRRRIKEIGIRKVNGATIKNVIYDINNGIVSKVLIAFTLASPVAYIVISKVLESYAYKTQFAWWIFLVGGVLSLVVAFPLPQCKLIMQPEETLLRL